MKVIRELRTREFFRSSDQLSVQDVLPVRLRVEGDRATGSCRELSGAPSCSQITLTGSGGPWATQLRLSDTLATTVMCCGSTEK